MSAIIFIVETLLSLALFVILARLLLQWTRADFRNPLCQAVVRITNPLILPLRRVLPPIGKLDTASVVAVLLIATVDVACIFALHALGFPPPLLWVRPVLTEIDRKSTRLNSSHSQISYAVFCLKNKKLVRTELLFTLSIYPLVRNELASASIVASRFSAPPSPYLPTALSWPSATS